MVHFGEGTKDALQDVSLGSMVMSSRETWLQTSHNLGQSQDFDPGGGWPQNMEISDVYFIFEFQ
jgi:hypothetical protein